MLWYWAGWILLGAGVFCFSRHYDAVGWNRAYGQVKEIMKEQTDAR